MPMASETQSVLEKISGEYYSLTSSEKKTADYVLSHLGETQFMSISELAEACDVAEATISRFCRRLEYKGYNAFKLAIANAAAQRGRFDNPLSGEVVSEDSAEDICRKLLTAHTEAMRQTMDVLSNDAVCRAADLLESADKVLCMGQGGSMLMANEAAHLFSTATNKFFAVSDAHIQAMTATMMGEEDVILYFSYSGATLDMMETLKLAQEQGGKVILVTRFPNSPGSALADVVLQIGGNESPLQAGSVAARIAQMYLLDVLFSEFSRRNLEVCRQNRKRIADALADKHL